MRRAIAMQSAMDNAKDDATKEELSGDYTAEQLEADLQDFCRQTGRRNDTFRQQVHGFGRSEAQRAVHQNNLAFQESMRKKGFQNPPKSLAKMEKMRYNDPKEYALMKSYEKSVDTGMMSPLVGYEKYKEYHQRVELEDVKEALEHGKAKKHPSRDVLTFATDKCIVSVNTKTGNLIQVTPQ